jgi:SAM-dependent methyltransferase
MQAPTSNEQQVAHWNEVAGPRWVAWAAAFDRMISPYGDAAIAALKPQIGERIVDVGCGFGATAESLARRVGQSGRVLGIDIAAPMLAHARERICDMPHVTLAAADAQTHAFAPGAWDAVFSRFGVMFFADPTAAFANLRVATTSRGRLAFACWQASERNPWHAVTMAAVARVVALPAPPPAGAPGPFAFADADGIRRVLASGGWHGIEVMPHETTVDIGATGALDDAVAFVVEAGPASRVLDGIADDDIRAWIVTARATA